MTLEEVAGQGGEACDGGRGVTVSLRPGYLQDGSQTLHKLGPSVSSPSEITGKLLQISGKVWKIKLF